MRNTIIEYFSVPYPWRIQVRLNHLIVEIRMNQKKLGNTLTKYFHEFLSTNGKPDIIVHCYESDVLDWGIDYTEKEPDPGKARIKEEYADIDGFRIVRKRLTGMLFAFNDKFHLAVGPCEQNSNQVINFVNNRYIQWMLRHESLLLHAAGVRLGDKGLALCGFAGMGKSTLALHLLGAGFDFVSNDRLMINKTGIGLQMYGLVKYPRINPGTILNNPLLHSYISSSEKETLLKMPDEELRKLENKYDVIIEDIYGSNRFHISSGMFGLVILNWNWTKSDPIVTQVDLHKRRDLLPSFMKSPGLFYLPGVEDKPFDEESYLDVLDNCLVFEITGGVDFQEIIEQLKLIIAGKMTPNEC